MILIKCYKHPKLKAAVVELGVFMLICEENTH